MSVRTDYTDFLKAVKEILDGYVDAGAEDTLYECFKNGLSPLEAVDVIDSQYADDYDGQPDERQEWEDFGEVYSDDYPLFDGGEY